MVSLSAISDWTILIYMAADNGLSDYAIQDINDMESVVIPSGTNVIVQADFSEYSDPSGAYRYLIRQDNSTLITSPVLANLNEIDSGNAQTLRSFIAWGFGRYPANHKALVIWSHGDSWYKGTDYKWICTDNSSESLMSVANGDLRDALAGCPPLDILLFDACSMQSYEVYSSVSMINPSYVIGSMDLVPATGFPYQDMLPVWSGNADTLAVQIPEIYVNSYAPYGSQNPEGYNLSVCCSAIRADITNEKMVSEVETFAMHYIDMADVVYDVRMQCRNFNSYDAEIDLMQFTEKMLEQDSTQAQNWAYNYLKDMLDYKLAAKSAIGYASDVGYISIWYPWEINSYLAWWQHYGKLFSISNWSGLVSAGLGADSGLPVKPDIRNAHFVLDKLVLELNVPILPELVRANMKFIFDDEEIAYLPWQSGWRIYSDPDEYRRYHMMNVIGSGWLYAWTEDRQGNVSAMDSVHVNRKPHGEELYIYPNPAHKSIPVYFNWWLDDGEDGYTFNEVKIYIYNIKGQKVAAFSSYRSQGDIKADLVNLACGVYLAKLKAGKKSFSTRFTLLN